MAEASEREQAPDEEEESIPGDTTASLPGEETPLSGIQNKGHWALLNLLLAIFSLLLTVLTLVITRRKKQLAQIAGTLVAILLFLFTQNLGGTMAVADWFTPLFLIIVAGQCLWALLQKKQRQHP